MFYDIFHVGVPPYGWHCFQHCWFLYYFKCSICFFDDFNFKFFLLFLPAPPPLYLFCFIEFLLQQRYNRIWKLLVSWCLFQSIINNSILMLIYYHFGLCTGCVGWFLCMYLCWVNLNIYMCICVCICVKWFSSLWCCFLFSWHYINCVLKRWLLIICLEIRERYGRCLLGGVIIWERVVHSFCFFLNSHLMWLTLLRAHSWGPDKGLEWQGPPSPVSGSSLLNWAKKST